MGTVNLKTASGGSVILSPANTAVDVTITVPAVTAGLVNDSVNLLNIGSGQLVKDASGNLGLGVTPSAWSSAYKILQVNGGAAFWSANSLNAYLSSNVYRNASITDIYTVNGYATRYSQNDGIGYHAWYNAPSGTAGAAIAFTQAMTLDASGRLLVGTTADPVGYGGSLSVSGAGHCTYMESRATGGYAVLSLKRANATSGDQQYFVTTSGLAGIISSNGLTTNYGTSSDYRLKDDVQPMVGALAKVALLKPVTYKWKWDGSESEGFIAHELQGVKPEAVLGEKDAINEDGSIKPQNIDVSFLVATLTAAIQEQQALITQLQADVAALKGA